MLPRVTPYDHSDTTTRPTGQCGDRTTATTTAPTASVESVNGEPGLNRANADDFDPSPANSDMADLDAIGADLADVETALRRLDDGTYWTDEVTGEVLPDDLLAANPVARRMS